jgi:hypothetical protein
MGNPEQDDLPRLFHVKTTLTSSAVYTGTSFFIPRSAEDREKVDHRLLS